MVKNILLQLKKPIHLFLKYSQDGKPLLEDGPIHVLLRDGSNIDNPIKNVSAIRAE